MTMQLTLRHKINGAILITFVVISLIFISIQLLIQRRHSKSISEEIKILLEMVVERESGAIANEIFQNLDRALILRLDRIREKGNIPLISVFDKSGRLMVSRGILSETQVLSEAQIAALSEGIEIRRETYQGVFSMVYLKQIDVIGEKVGFIRICYSLESLKQEQRESMMLLGALLVSILVIMLTLLNFIMSRTIVKPILSLSESMNRMEAGKFEAHIYPNRKDEIGTLSNVFNRMARDLATSYQEVDLKRTQLLNARQYLSNIINSMPSILLGVDETLKVTLWNLQAEKITGIEPASAIGRLLAEILPQIYDASQMVQQALRDHTTRKQENVKWEIDGRPGYVDITVYPLLTSGKKEAFIRVDDVTERRLTQEALHESQEKYRFVVENANDGIIIVQDGIIKFANKKAGAMSGYSAEELASKHFSHFVSEEDRATNIKNYTNRMQGKSVPSNYNFQIKHKTGKSLWANNSTVLITWDNRPATLNFIRDISDLKKAEEQLLHSQKMDAIGTLAGGIAHDFNNLLQVIQGYAQLLLFERKGQKNSRRELEAILNAAKKGGELTMQLLTFGRKVESYPKLVNINAQIEKTKKMLSRTIPKMIEIKLLLTKPLPAVHVDPGQIEQVVMNLVINARDAMPEGGQILIKTETVTLDEEGAKSHLVQKPGKYVLMSVSDSGHGIPENVLDHIFEPFFTTKKLGDGTGLGLAIVYGIVKNHNGSIQCYSVPGKGTTFSVYFPPGSPSEKPSTGKMPVVPATLVGGTETVLLVDDEETLRDIGQQLLEKFGYAVVTASNAEEALEIYSTQPGRFHLVILDLVMPGMGGKKCVDALLELNPEVKIVIASGYFGADGKDIGKDKTLAKTKGFIKKPFVLESMLQEVRRVLDDNKIKSPGGMPGG